ncbi:MAG: molybdenum cofactor biosynthesis protein MoaE [Sphingomonadaceae bacterium]
MIIVRVGAADFDVAAELARLEALGGGAVASFTGIVRGSADFVSLTLDHYPAMTQAALEALAKAAATRWPLHGVTIIHRVGELGKGARIVLVGTASDHRAAALEACAFLIDRLKTGAPFWKKERGADGVEVWVDARNSDDAAAARWY